MPNKTYEISLALASLLFAACGDDGSGSTATTDATGSTSSDAASATAPTTAPTTVGMTVGGDDSSTGTSDGGATMGESSSSSEGGTSEGGTAEPDSSSGPGSDSGSSSDSGSGSDSASSSGSTGDDGSSSSSSSGGSDLCAPAGPLTFDAATWEYFTTPNNTLVASDDTELTLIPDNLTSVGATVFYVDGVQMPYTVSFEYWIFDDDGSEIGSIYNSADGIAVAVAKDATSWATADPPDGGWRGIFDDGTGYAIDFAIFENRRISIRDGDGNVVAGPVTPATSVYPHGQWRSVSIEVTTAGIEVTYEGGVELTYAAALDETYDRIAFGAGTGGADGEHRIRNVEITCP